MAPRNRSSNAEEIAVAVAAALARSNSEAAQAAAKTASDVASELARGATQTALDVNSMRSDVAFIKGQLESLSQKFEKMSDTFVAKDDHDDTVKQIDRIGAEVDSLKQKFWLASGGLTVLVFFLNFFIKDVG